MLAGLNLRLKKEQAVIKATAWAAMIVVLSGVIMRDVTGDTARYYRTFLRLREQSLWNVLDDSNRNWLFDPLNWLLGLFGDSHYLLIAPIAIFCTYMLWRSLKQIFVPIHAAIALFIYSAYPYYIFYIASGMKQAIAMVLLLQAFVCFFLRRRSGWVWLLLAPMLHSGAALVYPFVLFHLYTYRPRFGRRRALKLGFLILTISTLLAVTNINDILLRSFKEYIIISENYELYFQDATLYNYRAGFRLDFTLFSLGPIIFAIFLRLNKLNMTLGYSGWWLNLYLLLISIYQLFAFAPFADRFAGFGWFILPIVTIVMAAETRSRIFLQLLVIVFILTNLALLQYYTGDAIIISL